MQHRSTLFAGAALCLAIAPPSYAGSDYFKGADIYGFTAPAPAPYVQPFQKTPIGWQGGDTNDNPRMKPRRAKPRRAQGNPAAPTTTRALALPPPKKAKPQRPANIGRLSVGISICCAVNPYAPPPTGG